MAAYVRTAPVELPPPRAAPTACRECGRCRWHPPPTIARARRSADRGRGQWKRHAASAPRRPRRPPAPPPPPPPADFHDVRLRQHPHHRRFGGLHDALVHEALAHEEGL